MPKKKLPNTPYVMSVGGKMTKQFVKDVHAYTDMEFYDKKTQTARKPIFTTQGKANLLENQTGPKAQKELGTKLLTGEISEKQFNKGVDKVVDSTVEKGQSQTHRTKGKQRILESGGPKTSRMGAGLSMLKNRFRSFGAKKWWQSKTH